MIRGLLAVISIAAFASCGGLSRRERAEGDGATAGESNGGATGGSGGRGSGATGGRSVSTGGTSEPSMGGSGLGATGGTASGGVSGAPARNCRDCLPEYFCAPDHSCVPYACRLEEESCGEPLCESGAACSVTWGELSVLPAKSTAGLCYTAGELFVVDGNAGVLEAYRWPDLVQTFREPMPSGAHGDCAVVGDAVYFPGRNGIGKMVLSSRGTALPGPPVPYSWPRAVAADEGSLWVSLNDAEEIVRLSLDGAHLWQVPNRATRNECDALEATPTGLWCADLASMVLFKLSNKDGSVLAGPFFSQPTYALVLIDGTLWASDDGSSYDPAGHLTLPDDPVEGLHPLILDGVEP